MNRLKFFFVTLSSFVFLKLNATHNRAGEITYKRIAPTSTVIGGVRVEVYRYLITLVKYTDYGQGIADRCADTLYFGDGERAIVFRKNGTNTGCNTLCSSSVPCGSIIISEPGFVVNKSVYEVAHTYPGPGNYLIRTFDPNRNGGVINITNSINQPFYVESLLIINGFTGANTSPELTNAPIDKGCVGQCFEHNPAAYDVDGDSLSYELTTSRGEGGLTVTGYSFPNAGPGGYFSINAITGQLDWCRPQAEGEYNIAFIVKEWRKNTNRVYELIGYVLRDMQIIIGKCLNTQGAPIVRVPADTCVEAGTFISKGIVVSSPNNGHFITLEGSGGAFNANSPKASLSNAAANINTVTAPSFTARLSWQTTCDHIREQPYYTTFKAQDNNSMPKQVTFNTFSIRVVPPSVKNVTATPFGTSMRVSWSLSSCNPASNRILNYRIYRKLDCTPYVPTPCQYGLAATSGYVLIGTVDANTSTFLDDNNGDGLIIGQNYGYMVLAFYTDGTLSYGGSQVCAALRRDVPVITHVDVITTSLNAGMVNIRWIKPLTTVGNFDTTTFRGPYQYVLKHRTESGQMEIVFTATSTVFSFLPASYTHSNLNTSANRHEYLVEFISGTVTIGSSQRATSVFLSLTPSDRRMDINWSSKTPWNNYKYTVRRKNPGSSSFATIATTTAQSYRDENNVVNKNEYCYQVISEGEYSDPSIIKPLINNSQEACALVKDETPPCSPTLAIEADCPANYVKVTWNDARKTCPRSDDVLSYNLYFKATLAEEYRLDTSFVHTSALERVIRGKEYFSGCFAIQAVDSANNKSPLSVDFCFDNCPIFELPNIFTPNKDQVNDFFKAIRVRQIPEINLTIYDRWGNLVYKTKDPYFKWDGMSTITNQEVSEGTFFYHCEVFEPRLRGIVKRILKGTVTVAR